MTHPLVHIFAFSLYNNIIELLAKNPLPTKLFEHICSISKLSTGSRDSGSKVGGAHSIPMGAVAP